MHTEFVYMFCVADQLEVPLVAKVFLSSSTQWTLSVHLLLQHLLREVVTNRPLAIPSQVRRCY